MIPSHRPQRVTHDTCALLQCIAVRITSTTQHTPPRLLESVSGVAPQCVMTCGTVGNAAELLCTRRLWHI